MQALYQAELQPVTVWPLQCIHMHRLVVECKPWIAGKWAEWYPDNDGFSERIPGAANPGAGGNREAGHPRGRGCKSA